MRRVLFIGFLSIVLAACSMILSDHKVSPRTIIKSQGCIGPPPECMGGSDGGSDGGDDGE